MAAAVVGEAFGPRPGKAICSFWQGSVQMLFWTWIPWVGCLPALISAAVALGEEESMLSNDVLNSTSELVTPTRIVTGCVIGVTGIAFLTLEIYKLLRLCNIGAINYYSKHFLSAAIIFNIMLMLDHLAVGAASTYYTCKWEVGNIVGNSLASAAAFCFLTAVLLFMSVIWDIVYLAKGWNDKVVRHTIEEVME